MGRWQHLLRKGHIQHLVYNQCTTISALYLLIRGIAFNNLLLFLSCHLTVVQTTSGLHTPVIPTPSTNKTLNKFLAEEAGIYPVLKEMKPSERDGA